MRIKILWLFLIIIPVHSIAQNSFNEIFSGNTMRLDFVFTGNSGEVNAYFQKISKEKEWYGSRKYFRDPFINGNYYFEIIDENTDSIIFQQGFNSLFGEWQTTTEAKEIDKSFQRSVYFPCPLKPFTFKLNRRIDRDSAMQLMDIQVNPDDYLISFDESSVPFEIIETNGPAAECVDLAFIAEGYTANEYDKFISDVKRFSEYMFNMEPYRNQRNKFNIYAVLSYSRESGTDNPGMDQWVNTRVGSSFYTFGSERYLTTSEYWKVCDQVTNIPHDHILIIVNTDKYGGGGIYNHYSIFSSDHELSEVVFVHEFGHGFAGLGDEYYTSDVAYENFYDLDKEPLPPNLTTLLNFDLKWKKMLDEDTPVPTPATEEFINTIGAFEGGGYVARGVYRPQLNCRMKSNEAPGFCKVCQDAINKMIDHYSDE